MRLHLDTDFAGDPDDACALAMLLGDPDVEIVGITTALGDRWRRAACVGAVLEMVGRTDIPVAAGMISTLDLRRFECTWDDRRHWPDPPPVVDTGPTGVALDLLDRNVRSGATVLAIGGFNNLAVLELSRPGILAGVPVVAMAGWVDDPATGWPDWGPAMDFNTQCDPRAALMVAESWAELTLVQLPVAMRCSLTARDREPLARTGPLGALLAEQSRVHGEESGFAELAAEHPQLPADLVNFHWDPLAAAVAAGWSGVTTERVGIRASIDDGVTWFRRDSHDGRAVNLITDVDAEAFGPYWLERVRNAQRVSGS